MRGWQSGLLVPALAMLALPASARKKPTLDSLARGFQHLVGGGVPGSIEIRSIAVEGDMLVITIDAVKGFRTYDRDRATRAFLTGFCRYDAHPKLFALGRLRVDTLDRGRDLKKGLPVTSCVSETA